MSGIEAGVAGVGSGGHDIRTSGGVIGARADADWVEGTMALETSSATGGASTGARSAGTRSAGTVSSILDQLLGGRGAPLTEQGLFLLMYEMMQAQNNQIQLKVEQFRSETAKQKQYANYTNMMQRAQAVSQKDDDGVWELHRENLAEMGLSSGEIDELMAEFAGSDGVLSPAEFGGWLNKEIFGAENPELYVIISTNTFDPKTFQDQVLAKIEAAQSANCADTTLLTTELSQLVHQQQRLSSMFSNTLNKLHESSMSVIRNI